MEKFINNLYSNSNFPIILGALIVVFVILFVITLILALKDAKNNLEFEEESKDKENKDKVSFQEKENAEPEEKVSFENVSFDKEEEEKTEEKSKYEGISFDEASNTEPTDVPKVDVIEETTQTIPVLKDEEISNFEEFFLQNLKDKKDNNIFDFSKKEDSLSKEVENTNQGSLESKEEVKEEVPAKEEMPLDMELPKMKQEYTFKELDGESYKLNK